MKKLIQSFKKNICSCCKSEHCERGITFTPDGARCVDYEKDESKIQKYVKMEYATARKRRAKISMV